MTRLLSHTLRIFSVLLLLTAAEHVHANANLTEAQLDSIERACERVSEMETVVVTGTRTPKLLKETPILTRVLSADDIRKADATNIQDLLQAEMPGVELTYAMNQQVNMNISGFSGQSVLILVDGEPLAGETLDNIDFTRIAMTDVERIEIVKGAASALYGSSAIGGVINIITKRPKDPWTLHLDGRYGHHNEQRYNVYHDLRQGIYSHSIAFSRTSSDNYSLSDRDRHAATRTVSQVDGDRTGMAKYGATVDVKPSLKLSARLGYFRRTVERTPDTPDRYHDYTGGIRGAWDITSRDHMELSYSFDQYDKSKYQRLALLDIRDYSNVKNSTRLLYSHNFSRGDVLTVGADYLYDYLMSNNLAAPVHQQNFDAFAQYDWKVTSEWGIVSAVRYDYFSEGSLSRVTPKVSACWRSTPRCTMRLSYGMGFRAPTLKELYNDFDMAGIWIVEGNKNLRPESSHDISLSGEYLSHGWNFIIAGFYNRIYNHITTGVPYYKTGDTRQLYLTYINLGDMNVYGAEVTVTKRWDCGLGMKLGYTYTHEDVSGRSATPYMPARAHSFTVRTDWDRQFNRTWGLNVALSGKTFSAIDNLEYANLYDISAGTHPVHYPAYSMWKFQASVRLRQWCQIRATVDNLFNYRPDYYYYNAPLTTGTSFLVGLSLDIDKIK